MRWSNLRGLLCLAAAIAVSSTASAADSYYVASATSFGGVDISASPAGISNAGIDRLVEVNGAGYSVLGSQDDVASSESTAESESTNAVAPIATAGDDSTDIRYLLAGVGAAFAMGLGLCFAGLTSGRKRTVNAFTAGYIQLAK